MFFANRGPVCRFLVPWLTRALAVRRGAQFPRPPLPPPARIVGPRRIEGSVTKLGRSTLAVNACLGCYAKENGCECGLTGCGPYCNGKLLNHCRACSQDGKEVCAGDTCTDRLQKPSNPRGQETCAQTGCWRGPGTPGCCVGKRNCTTVRAARPGIGPPAENK